MAGGLVLEVSKAQGRKFRSQLGILGGRWLQRPWQPEALTNAKAPRFLKIWTLLSKQMMTELTNKDFMSYALDGQWVNNLSFTVPICKFLNSDNALPPNFILKTISNKGKETWVLVFPSHNRSCQASGRRPPFLTYERCCLPCLSLYNPILFHFQLQGGLRAPPALARPWHSPECICSEASWASAPPLTGVQISLRRLPTAYLNSLAPMKSGRLNSVQTSRLLLPGFKNLLKILLETLLYCYHEFSL